jgi:leucine-rich repeat protein SHOC2
MTYLVALVIALVLSLGGYYFMQTTENEHETDTSVTGEVQNVPASNIVNRSGQNLTKMPNDILAMTSVQQLNLSNNQLIGALPAEIRHLSNLQALNISNNKMTGLPAELGQLSKLRILNAANNQLTGIPHELGNLRNLEILNLSGNNISEFDLQEIRKKLPASTQIIL